MTPCDPRQYACDNPPIAGPAGTFSGTSRAFSAYLAWHLRCHRGEDRTNILSTQGCRTLHSPADARISQYGYGWFRLNRSWGNGYVFSHSGTNTMNYHTMWLAPNINL